LLLVRRRWRRSLVRLRLLALRWLRLILLLLLVGLLLTLLLRWIRLLLLLRVLLGLRAKAEAQTKRQRQCAARYEFRLLGIIEARHVLYSCP
jgi:hypothetical protein